MLRAGAGKLGRLRAETAALFVCDVQEKFRPGMASFDKAAEAIGNSMRSAQVLGIPTVMTEQYPEKLGKTVKELSDLMDSSAQCFPKTCFSMLTPEVKKILKEMAHVQQIILCGLETHVCVLQTAIDLTEQGYEVHVLVDGVVSRRQGDRQVALERMKQMGCWMSTSEMAMFQMIAEKEHPKFRDISGIAKTTRSDGPWMAAI
jgi:nicotinamidase-related amidase